MSGETITIRHLGPEDPHVLENVRAGVFDHPVDPSWAWRFLATGVNEIVVAQSAGQVVGFASGTVLMHPDKEPFLFVNEVSVHPDLQRQGIGKTILQRLMDVARDRGCIGFWLATNDDNTAALGLYEAAKGKRTDGIVMFEWDAFD